MDTQTPLLAALVLLGISNLGVLLYKIGRYDERLVAMNEAHEGHRRDITQQRIDHTELSVKVSRIEGELAK